MTRKELRAGILAALESSAWVGSSGIRAFMLDGTPEALDAYEGDLRSTSAGAVFLVGHVLKGKYIESAMGGRKLARTCEVPVLVRINQAHASAPDPDEAIDEVIKAVSGSPVGKPGDPPIAYLSESLLQDSSPSLFSTTITFAARIVTVQS